MRTRITCSPLEAVSQCRPSFVFFLAFKSRECQKHVVINQSVIAAHCSRWPLILPCHVPGCPTINIPRKLLRWVTMSHILGGELAPSWQRPRSCTGPSGTWSNTSQIPQLGSFSLHGCLDELLFFPKHVPNSSRFRMPLFKIKN